LARRRRRLKPAKFDERLTLVEHLDELRNRIIFSGVVLVIAIAFCFWQDEKLLDIANDPLPANAPFPITFSPTEPFFTTVRLSVYGGILITLPLLLYQVYAFVLPAFAPHERKLVLPFLLSVPVLFIGGAVFAYFVVMPAAVNFLLDFNDDQFNIQLRAREYYGFFAMMEIASGLLFQLPLAIIAITRLGIVRVEQLSENRRYAYLVIAILAAALPGVDPITMLIEMVPLLVLFELSILLARVLGRPPRGVGLGKPSTQE
jgi:sec-independent protein translocase protein TatC